MPAADRTLPGRLLLLLAIYMIAPLSSPHASDPAVGHSVFRTLGILTPGFLTVNRSLKAPWLGPSYWKAQLRASAAAIVLLRVKPPTSTFFPPLQGEGRGFETLSAHRGIGSGRYQGVRRDTPVHDLPHKLPRSPLCRIQPFMK